LKKIVIVIQARTNSSRLPGKVLLPIGGLPVVVLAAKRVLSEKNIVIVATSDEKSDDHLASVVKGHGITVFRGALNNVLKRFVDCLSDYKNETIVVRLTADNIFPDAGLITEITDEFVDKELDYLCLNGELSGLPYGVSAEVMSLEAIREAYDNTYLPTDLEHVTPYLRRKYGEIYYQKHLSLDLGMYRCTIDSFSDYVNMTELFSQVQNPVQIPTFELIKILESNNKLIHKNNKLLVLGTAQLGFDYGINNESGRPTKTDSFNILSNTVENGSQYIDTANAYGNSESVIGDWLSTGWRERVKVITKLSPLTSLNDQSTKSEITQKVDESLYQSLLNLKIDIIDVFMLHRSEHISSHASAIFNRVLYWRSQGKISSLGVSVQSPEELEIVLNYPEIEFIQLPFNILDSRWKESIKKLIQEKDKRVIKVHVRSVFLQGLLLTNKKSLWLKANEDNPEKILSWLNESTIKLNQKDINSLCINYAISKPWVDAIVVGVDNTTHLDDAFKSLQLDRLTTEQIDNLERSRPNVCVSTLNPSLWKKI
jgi:spore coat polysaccharide biosynthesis protein SpsF (cytidylyltransferase family)/aryl-alcohol dehydrogenase-like predicted oxidoreductase